MSAPPAAAAAAAAAPPRCAIVTGGTSGIGLAVVRRLLRDGLRVLTTSRSAQRLAEAFPEEAAGAAPRPAVCVCDLATTAGCEAVAAAAAAAFGEGFSLALLVNNAGGGAIAQQVGRASMETFDATFALNVRAPFLLVQLLLPRLARGACVVNLSSVAAARPFAGMGPYCMSKAAVDMFTQAAALELAPRGVRVVGVAPGTVETAFHARAGMGEATAAAYYEASQRTHPLGRVGRPEEVAEAVAWLGGDGAGFITGTTLVIDGGRLLTSSTAPQLGASAPAEGAR